MNIKLLTKTDASKLLNELPENLEKTDLPMEILKLAKNRKGEKGDKGDTPTKEEIIELIKPLIPEPIPGEPGKDADEKIIVKKATSAVLKEIPTVGEIIKLIPRPKNGIDGEDGVDGENPKPKEVIKEIENLEGKEAEQFGKAVGKKIDISYIKNAQSFLFNGKRVKLEELMHGGGLTTVSHDTTLTGDGTPANPLSALTSEGDFLKLDQTSSQTIINGQPIWNTLTASQLLATDANKKLQSLAVATYPSLTELSYVKGVTSAIQTQLNGKEGILIRDTETNILAMTPTLGLFAWATDLNQLMVANGSNWWIDSSYVYKDLQAPDMGYVQGSNRAGYGTTYVTDKVISNSAIGSNANTVAGGLKYNAIGLLNLFPSIQAYLGGVWKNLVAGINLQEILGVLEQTPPVGYSYNINVYSGNSTVNGLNGVPTVQQYVACMGAYPFPGTVDGGTF